MVAPGAAVALYRSAHGRRLKVWAAIAGLVVLALGILSYRFRGHLSSGFGLLADATGGRTVAVLCLILALFVLVCTVCWMSLPILLFFGLSDLRRRSARLEQSAALCVRHLAQLSSREHFPASEPEPQPKAPGVEPP